MATRYIIRQKPGINKYPFVVTVVGGNSMGPQHIVFAKRSQAERFVREAKKGKDHHKILKAIWHL